MEIEKKIIELEKDINKPISDIRINMDSDTAVKLFKLSKHMSEDEYWCFLEGSLKSAIYDKFAELFKEEEHMIEGRLGYNPDNKRYGIIDGDTWKNKGITCGELLEVIVDDKWVQTRMEMAWEEDGQKWYLVGTPYKGNLECIRARQK